MVGAAVDTGSKPNPVGKAEKKPEPERAEIFEVGKGNTYEFSGKGGITTDPKRQQLEPLAPPMTPERALQEQARKAPPKPVQQPEPQGQAPEEKPSISPEKRLAELVDSEKQGPAPEMPPPVKTKKKREKKHVTTAEKSKQLADGMVSSFVDTLTAKAKSQGGTLSVTDLASMNKDFQKQAADMKASLEQSFEDLIKDHDRKAWDKARKRPFDRMIVKCFSHMLEDDSRSLDEKDLLSRRMLPGFFMALNMMLGPDTHDAYQGQCRAVAKMQQRSLKKDFDWDDVYEDDRAKAVRLDALIDIVMQFKDFDRRAEWFIDLVNTHMAPVANPSNLTEAEWQFTREGFSKFFEALLHDLQEAIESETGRMRITKAYGVDAVVELVELMDKLKSA